MIVAYESKPHFLIPLILNHLTLFEIQVVTDLDGGFIVQIGSSGEEGLQDGSFDDATFNRPQVRTIKRKVVLVMIELLAY